MTNTNKADKCIAVKTPFGLIELELGNGGQYVPSYENGVVTKLSDLYSADLCFFAHDSEWVNVIASDRDNNDSLSVLPIISYYGDQFPQ